MRAETEPPELDALLDRYEGNDHTAGRQLMDLRASMDAQSFSIHIRKRIYQRPPSIAMRFVASLLKFEDIVQMLMETYRRSREQAFALAGKLQTSDPRFDTLLLKRYADKSSLDSLEAELLIALDILDVVSERDRLVLGVSKFLRHPNANLRSKAAMFLARRRPTLGLIADLERELDPIVRAGLIEGLYDRKEDFVPPLFRKHVTDENHQVAGNALYGLYRLGDTGAIQLIDEMAKDSRPEFRDICARVMGQTGDPRFSSNLAAQLSDVDERVRKQALRGLGEMKKTLAAVRSHNSVQLNVLKYRFEEGRRSLIATVCRNSGEIVRGILPTKFLLKISGSYVREYDVQEYICGTPINAGFVMCEPPKGEASVRDEFDEAVERCSTLQRTRDRLGVSKLTHETHLRLYANDTRSSAGILTKALTDIDFEVPNLNLVVVGATSHTRVIDRLLEIGSALAATIHIVAVSPEWRSAELQAKVEKGGGFFRSADAGDVTQVCLELYAAFLHQYEVSWEGPAGKLELEVRAECGTGLAEYQVEDSSAEV